MGGGAKPLHTVVIGGGTAGWFAALILQAEAKRQGIPMTFTLVESSKVPPIGVGEGSTSVFRGVLQSLGLDEREFLAQTDATIKYGIRHRDWRQLGHVYDGPIDDVYHLADTVPDGGLWIDTFCVAAGRPVTRPHVFAALMTSGKAPVALVNGREVPVSAAHHAFHFDQAKVGAWLRTKAKGITIVDALVQGAERCPESGDITSVKFEDGQELSGDLFVDATGFRRSLIGTVMESEWVSYADELPVNRAMPFWLDHEAEAEIPTFTHAWAQKSGWMWQIPTAGRIGCGYVYSDAHISPDQAQEEIETVLGHPIEPRNDIRMNAGRLDEVWRGNVLAVGLASSFLEPLEATSIHGTLVTLLLFAKRHLAGFTNPDLQQRVTFNAAIAGQVDDFRDFINLHYVSERRDSDFWCDVAQNHILPQTRDRLEIWQRKMPDSADFSNNLDGLPHLEELLHFPVLDGLGLLSKEVARGQMAQNPKLRNFARDTVDFLTDQAQRTCARALGHRAWLETIRD